MRFEESPIKGVFVVNASSYPDKRGWFARMFCKREFQEIGIDAEFVQLNQSYNHVKGTFRGMHYQVQPFAEKKLVRCVAGAVNDVVVDLRKNSATFRQTFSVELSAENMAMILVPEGVAHGFITLEDKTSLLYHHTAFHNPASERGLRFDDPHIRLKLPIPIAVMSERDMAYPLLGSEFEGVEP